MTISSAVLEFPPEHPALRGHFPGNPVVPAVALLDEVLHQASSIDSRAAATSSPRWKISSAKFYRPLRPGEPLALELERQADGNVRFKLSSAGTLIAQGLLLCASGGTAAA